MTSLARLAALPLLLTFACDADPQPLTELGQAQADFAELSASHGDNYDYVSSRPATPTGDTAVHIDVPYCVWTTTLEVREGVLVRRSVDISESAPGAECPASFSEEGDALGADASIHAAPAITLDEWYTLCESEVTDSESDLGGIPVGEVPYEIDEDGTLLWCGWQASDAGLTVTSPTLPFFKLDSLSWI